MNQEQPRNQISQPVKRRVRCQTCNQMNTNVFVYEVVFGTSRRLMCDDCVIDLRDKLNRLTIGR